MIIFDELTHFEESQFTYLLTRLRSSAEGNSSCMATCNPDNASWVLKWVKWYLAEDGRPDPDKSGVIRYFVIVNDEPFFAESPEEIEELFPEKVWDEDPRTGKKIYVPPMSFTFIGGTVYDNPKMLEKNPRYISNLKNQPRVQVERLLYGNWYAREEASGYFKREWLSKADKVPLGSKEVRAWDKAATEPSEGNKTPDFTASVKMVKDSHGNYYIKGDYIPENKDKGSDILGKFRKRSGARDVIVCAQALADGEDCIVVLPQDAGSAGVDEYKNAANQLLKVGARCKKDPMPNNKSKLVRFSPFASAAENGLVYIVETSFTPASLNAYLNELEAFDGSPSTRTRKDDWPDATASAFNYLSKQSVIPSFRMPDVNTRTRIHGVMKDIRR